MVQTKLDKDRHHGYVVGTLITEGKAVKYQQDGLDFDHNGVRLTPYTDDEQVELEVRKKVEEKRQAKKTVPDMKNWGKAAVLNHMRMRFPDAAIDETMGAADLKERCEELYQAIEK